MLFKTVLNVILRAFIKVSYHYKFEINFGGAVGIIVLSLSQVKQRFLVCIYLLGLEIKQSTQRMICNMKQNG